MRLWSPTDLSAFAESPWVSWLDRLAREEPDNPLVRTANIDDPFLEMLGSKGAEREAAVLSALLRGDGGSSRSFVDLSSGARHARRAHGGNGGSARDAA